MSAAELEATIAATPEDDPQYASLLCDLANMKLSGVGVMLVACLNGSAIRTSCFMLTSGGQCLEDSTRTPYHR